MRRRANLPLSAIMTRRLWLLVVRAVFLTVTSFAIAFGFLSGTIVSGPHYNPQAFAVGTAALFGAACGALGILASRIRQMKRELRTLETRLDEAADRNWEAREAQERAKSFFEAQGDVIVRRDGKGAITYANDAFCALAGVLRERLWAAHSRFRWRYKGRRRYLSTARACTIRKSRRRQARVGSRGARRSCAPTATVKCKASAAM
jgi:PAS domain-containing protein